MNAAWSSTVCEKPAGVSARPKPGASHATARRPSLGDGGQQRLEVRARAGVAVHAHDGF